MTKLFFQCQQKLVIPDGSLCRIYFVNCQISHKSPIPTQESLHDCGHDEDNFCPGSGSLDVAAVVCVDEQADLEPDIYDLMSSAHLEDKQLFFLQVEYI